VQDFEAEVEAERERGKERERERWDPLGASLRTEAGDLQTGGDLIRTDAKPPKALLVNKRRLTFNYER
jgi:hypothetical protein